MSVDAKPVDGSVLADLPGRQKLLNAGEMSIFFVRVVRTACSRPFDWRSESVAEMALALRRCLVPAGLSIVAIALGMLTVYLGGIVKTLGTIDRVGGGAVVGFIREPCVWVTTMILAGVAGSAMTADLGARKIRQELDAYMVLGVDPIRAIVLPRVVAMVIMGPVLSFITLLIAYTTTYFSVWFVYGDSVTMSAVVETARAFVEPADLVNTVIKTMLAGLVVGVVGCYKGMATSGGAEGVGRSVNQAVLIMFFGVWLINVLGNTIFLSLFPDVQILKG